MKIFKWKPSKGLILFIQVILAFGTLGFAYKALINLDIASAFSMGINWVWFLVAMLLLFGSLAVRSLILSRGILPELTDNEALYAVSFGNAMNLLLPFKLGEGMRYSVLPGDMNTKQKLIVMLFPAMYDTFFMGLGAIISALFSGITEEWFRDIILFAGVALCTVSALAVLAIYIFNRDGNYGKILKRLGVKGFLYMGLSWFFFISSAMLSFVAVGMKVTDAVRSGVFSHASTSLALLFPASPGALGLFEYAVVYGMSFQGITGSVATSAAITLHIVQYAVTLPLGLGYFAFNRIKQRRQKKRKA